VIAVIHGFALAGGLELALACDLAIASEDARIGDQHVNFGLMPGGGSTQRLPRRIGMQRAMELLTTGRWLSGTQAKEWGLVLEAVPSDELDQKLDELVTPLRAKSRAGLGWIKSVAKRGQHMGLRDGVALEIMAFTQYVATSTHPREGIQAFKEKRQPQF
jgi:enoyl-CoA hydratase